MESTNQMPKLNSQHVKSVSLGEANKIAVNFLDKAEENRQRERESEERFYSDPTTKIVSQIDARIKITGKYSGRDYLFEKAGSVQDVEEKDVEWMLGLRQGGRQCCGGSGTGNQIFALA